MTQRDWDRAFARFNTELGERLRAGNEVMRHRTNRRTIALIVILAILNTTIIVMVL